MSRLEEHLRRQAGILRNAEARLLLTVPEGRGLAALLRGQVESLHAIESVADLIGSTERASLTTLPASADTALIQYTSGSTGDPKGVVLSHANLLANVRAMGRAIEASSKDVFVSWLPLYHDMGLIGAWMGCLHHAAPLYVMSPMSFLMRPASWLWAIHRYRATLSASPNFGFELCLNKIDDAQLQALDLSSLRMIANGSEPVSAKTVRRFTDRFGRYGFRATRGAGLRPCRERRGLAFPPLGPSRRSIVSIAMPLPRPGVASIAATDDAAAVELVLVRIPLPEHGFASLTTWPEVGERRRDD
jgi:acyl-CoA synthetase (AMP-forming)/AMP-acid ligase II